MEVVQIVNKPTLTITNLMDKLNKEIIDFSSKIEKIMNIQVNLHCQEIKHQIDNELIAKLKEQNT